MNINATDFEKALNRYVDGYTIFEDLKVTASELNNFDSSEKIFFVATGWCGVSVHVSDEAVTIHQMKFGSRTETTARFTDHISMNMLVETLNHFIAGVYVYDKTLRKALSIQALNN